MTKEINDMNELERVLDVLRSIRDREVGRRHQPPHNNNYEQNNLCLLYTSHLEHTQPSLLFGLFIRVPPYPLGLTLVELFCT